MKKILASLLASLAMIGGAFFATVPVYAEENDVKDVFYDICKDGSIEENVKKKAGCTTDGLGATKDPAFNLAANIINVIIGITSTIALIFIIIGGINFMTSTGDPGKIKKAKDTILFAAIGLAICATAYVIVNWVIAKMIIGN